MSHASTLTDGAGRGYDCSDSLRLANGWGFCRIVSDSMKMQRLVRRPNVSGNYACAGDGVASPAIDISAQRSCPCHYYPRVAMSEWILSMSNVWHVSDLPQRFLLFSMARTGSTTLRALLHCHPAVRCIHEPFNPDCRDPIGSLPPCSVNSMSLELDHLWK